MPSQSLRASPEGIEKAQKALIIYSLTQSNLANALGVTRQPISNFFRGRKVSRRIFIEICTKLKLNWEDVVAKLNNDPKSDTPLDRSGNPISLGRSLRLSPKGILEAEKALHFRALTQKALAQDIGISRPTIVNFFGGKPVDRNYFIETCERLNLDWEDVVKQFVEQDTSINIDALVQEVREKIKLSILKRYGTIRVLDMTQPIGLNDIYTDVNILENITGRRRLVIAELQQKFTIESEEFDRFGLSRVTEMRVPGLAAVERYSKLMVLGKPGAGKTTFLKYLAIQCIYGQFQANRIPIFITLKDLAETPEQPDLLKFIIQQFSNNIITDAQIVELLNSGSFIILLDSLDEVREQDISRIIKGIEDFSNKYSTNHFVITSRIAASEYTFEQFTEVELADFNEEQIANFANQWFRAKYDIVKAERFIKRLKENQPILELATNPLLLTLLCLVFEELGSFPPNRSELYQEGLDVLLRKWDAVRNIERDWMYKNLSIRRREDLLSQIALETFKRGNYFFKRKEVELYIAQYIQNLPQDSTDPDTLQLDSEAILKSIEAQHGLLVERAKGIYSFSHLTFHEYFTAKRIVTTSNPQALEEALQSLATHITDKRWREVLLLTTGMLPSVDYLLQLMKQQVDGLLAVDEKLQQFLAWVNQKSRSVKAPYKPAAVRASYLDLALDLDLNLTRTLDHKLALELALDLDLDHNLALALKLALELALELAPDCDLAHDLAHDLALTLARVLNYNADNPEMKRSLQQLKDQLSNPKGDFKAYKHWWQENGQAWTEQLRSVMIQHRNIGYDWQFGDSQKELLRQYNDANRLLVDCLNSDCYVSRKVRQEIEDTLLLPVRY